VRRRQRMRKIDKHTFRGGITRYTGTTLGKIEEYDF